jgi:hypothetical protein
MNEDIKNPKRTFTLNSKDRVLTVKKSELKNIESIYSKVKSKTNFSDRDIAQFQLEILD